MATSDQFRSGQIAMTGSPVALTAIPKSVVSVVLKNLKANTGIIYIKEDSSLTTSNSYPLDPGESMSMDILNPGRCYAQGTNTERLAWATLKAG